MLRFVRGILSKHGNLTALVRGGAMLLVGDFGSAILQIATLAVTSHYLGAETFGVLVLIQTYAVIIQQLVVPQSWKALIKFGGEALATGGGSKFATFVKAAFLVDLAGASLCLLLSLFLTATIGNAFAWSDSTISLATLYGVSVSLGLIGMPTGVLRIFRRYRAFSMRTIFAAALRFSGSLLAIYFDGGLVGMAVAWMVADIIGYAILLSSALTTLKNQGYGRWIHTKMSEWQSFLKFTVWTSLSNAVSLPIKHFDVFIVASLVSTSAVGFYHVLKRVSELFIKFGDVVYQVLFPEYAMRVHQASAAETRRMLFLTSGAVGGLALLGAFVLISTSGWWLEEFFSTEFVNYTAVLIVLLIFRALWAALTGVYPLFIALGYVRLDTLYVLGGNIAYLVLAALLSAPLDLLGIVLALAVSTLGIGVVRLISVLGALREREVSVAHG